VTAAPTALHVNDAAFTAARLVAEARRRGLRWDLQPIASPPRDWSGVGGQVRRAAIGAGWLARLAVAARRHDIVHVHSASTLPHVRPATRRFVLHCHGSDVRAAQYQPARGEAIRAGLRQAEAVFYSTPDLAEHVLPHRPDAILLPVPVDVTALPRWQPAAGPARVVFASRWEDVKGLAAQLETAERLVGALSGRAEVVGLDWGPAAQAAQRLGVRLVPRLDHPAYLDLLAGATAVVGQSAGILSASELEAMGTGAPLAIPSPLAMYAESAPPVLGSDPASVTEAVLALVDDPTPHDPSVGRDWVQRWHGSSTGVDTVSRVYAAVMAAR
jgi:hypothetical protein